MSTTVLQAGAGLIRKSGMPLGRLIRAYFTEAEYECVRMLRAPSFAAMFLSLPVLLYLLFGVVIAGDVVRRDPKTAMAIFTGFSVFGIMGPAMFGFGVTIAIEREQGLLKLKRALPMPIGAWLIAKMIMAMFFAVIVMTTMTVAGILLGHVSVTANQALAVIAVNVFGVLPFCAIGLFIGTLVKGAAAPGFTHLIYLPMMYLSGLFFPMPKFLAAAEPIWPAYHLNRLAQSAIGGPGDGQEVLHFAVLSGLTLLFAAFAVRRLARRG
jgi:ABC-2 type transport system permease protein